MSSIPPYPFKHSGTLIVIGGDETRGDDVKEAMRRRPFAKIMCVNSASTLYRGDFICSSHVPELQSWRAAQEGISGPGKFTTHAAQWTRRMRTDDHPWVDFFWPGTMSQATSTFASVRVGMKMGFGEIIVAAAPMTETFDQKHGKAMADMHRRMLHEEASLYRGVVTAMSGVPRQIFGMPKEFSHGGV